MLKWCKSNNIQNNTFSVIIFSIFVFIVKAAAEKNIKLCLIFPAADFGFLRSRLSLGLNSFIKLWVLTGLMQAIKKTLRKGGIFYGALGGVRTHNLLIRSQMLYPVELRVRQQSF